jgi:hypothetical protein
MSNVQIPNLPAVTSLAGAELFEGVQAGTSVKISLNQIAEAIRFNTSYTIPVLVSQGGTGVTTLTGYVKGSGTTPFTASATIPNTDITGLGTISTQNANAVAITGGSITGITDLAVADGGTGASNAANARTNLGLGTMSTQNANAVAITGGSITGITDLAVADGGTGASDAAGARTNLGLGTMSTQNANAVAITGGAIDGTPIGATTTSTIAGTTGTFSGNLTVDTNTLFVNATNNCVGIGTSSPTVQLHVEGNTTAIATITTASITGTTLTVVTVVANTIAVGDRLYGVGVSPITRIVSQNSGTTGGAGTYTVSVSQTVGSGTMYTSSGTAATVRITDADTTVLAGQPSGTIEFFVSDINTPTAGVGAYISAVSEDVSPDTSLTFGTRDAAGGGVDANERMRIGSAGQIGIGGANYGTSGQTIVSGGPSAPPAYGTLPVAGGGTGVTTAPAAAAVLMGFTTTATATGTTVFTSASSQFQVFTGTLNQTITLPVTSTIGTGWSFHIANNSTGTLTVNSSGGNLVISIIAGLSAMVTCIGTTLTTAADWEAGFTDFQSLTGTGAVVLGTGPTITAAALNGTVGATTPSTGAFTTVTASTSVLSSGTGGVGYSTGAGVAPAQQLTSRTTSFATTGNSKSGALTLFTAAPVVGTYFSFTVPNTGIAVTDTVVLSVRGATNTYTASVTAITAATSFQITMASVAGVASDTPIVNFTIIKGVSA